MMYSEWLNQWLKTKEIKAKDSTISSYSLLVSTHIAPILGDMEIEKIDDGSLQDAIDVWVSEGNRKTGGELSEKTVAEILRVTKSSIKAYCKKNRIPVPLFDELEVPKVGFRSHEVFTPDEQSIILKAILKNITERTAGIALGLLCGMRIGEICALQWDSVDMKENLITVDATLQRIYTPVENSDKKSRILIDTPKTENSRRKIPMTTTMKNILTAIQPENSEGLYVLSGKIKPLEAKSLRDYYYRFLDQQGIRKLTFHTLRHTFGTKCITCNIDPATLCKIMGHANPTITINLYCHPQIDDMRKAMEVLDEKWLK